MRVLVLSHSDVLAALPPAACAEAMAAVLAEHARHGSYLPLRSVMIPPEAAGFMGLMPAWRGPQPGSAATSNAATSRAATGRAATPAAGAGRAATPAAGAGRAAAFAVKAVCIIPANPARGLDAHQGLVTLFDGQTGVPTAILDAAAVTEIRTAAVSAVATSVLARPGSRVLAILGAGTQGRAHLRALTLAGQFEQVRLYSPTPAHARELAGAAAGQGLEVGVAGSAREAVDGADVVVTATSSREPVLRHDWLKAGAHVNAVGASSPAARELDTATVAASALFCDSRESLRHEAGEFQLAIADGLIAGEEHIRAELGEVLAGTAPGRRDAAELTVFRSLGLAIEDLAAAQSAVAAAQARGLGAEIEL
jgi:ornithine cyclodeaminase/alanine dehydrogenase-like protein (mu-crystallin family)